MTFHTARVAPEKADFRPALPLCSSPGVNGTHMGKMTYGEQLKHPNWQRKRLEVLQGAEFSCANCGDAETTLHVHHKRYVKGRMAWEYDEYELEVLCEPCHSERHEHHELLDLLFCTSGINHSQAIGLLAGYLDCQMSLPEDIEPEARRIAACEFVVGQIAALADRLPWPRIGHLLSDALTEEGRSLNPAERLALDFLLSYPAPSKDL